VAMFSATLAIQASASRVMFSMARDNRLPFGKFLAKDRPATLADAVNHVMHVRTLAGSQAIALGSDFDGGFTPLDCPAGAQRPEELPVLEAALTKAGLTAADLKGFQHGNWLRVLQSALPD